MSIVTELQQEALNEKVPVAGLLRKALVVAHKLELKDFSDWIERELNGYTNMADVPEYRAVVGDVQVLNRYWGRYDPVRFGDPKHAERFSKMRLHYPLSHLEDLVSGKTGGGMVVQFNPEVEHMLTNAIGGRGQPALHVDPSQFRGILDAVRTAVLKWALELERKGITGTGLSFSKEEKTKAAHAVHIDTYIETMSHSQIQRDAHASTQTMTVHALDLEAVRKLMTDILGALDRGEIQSDALEVVRADINAIQAQLKSPKPNTSMIQEGLVSIRHILEHATGKVAGSGILAAIGVLVGA